MPAVKCAKCGGDTNTAVSNYWEDRREDGKAHYCYLRVEDGKWVKGCGFELADPIYELPSFNALLGKSVYASAEKQDTNFSDEESD